MKQILQSWFILCAGQQVRFLVNFLGPLWLGGRHPFSHVCGQKLLCGVQEGSQTIRQSNTFRIVPCGVSTHICRRFYTFYKQSCCIFYNRLTFREVHQSWHVSLLRGMSPAKLGQWDSSSAPKGAGSRSRAARPTQKHTYCVVNRRSHPLTLPGAQVGGETHTYLVLPQPTSCTVLSLDARTHGPRTGSGRRQVSCHTLQQVGWTCRATASGKERAFRPLSKMDPLRFFFFFSFLRNCSFDAFFSSLTGPVFKTWRFVDRREPKIVLINITAFVSEVTLNWNHLELRTNLMDQRASVACVQDLQQCVGMSSQQSRMRMNPRPETLKKKKTWTLPPELRVNMGSGRKARCWHSCWIECPAMPSNCHLSVPFAATSPWIQKLYLESPTKSSVLCFFATY